MAEKSHVVSNSSTIFAAFLCILMAIEVRSRSDLGFAGDTRFLRRIESNEVGFISRTTRNAILRKSSKVELDSRSTIAENKILCCKKGSFYSYPTFFSSPNTNARLRFRLNKEAKKRILSQETLDFTDRAEKLALDSTVLMSGNTTLLSRNRTFELGFFSSDGGSNWYLGIWYSSIPIRTYVWVANREKPVKNLASATASLTDGRLTVTDSSVNSNVWQTENDVNATETKLLETGNLVLLDRQGEVVWQSFDFPADTWLPGMKITRRQSLTCWKSESDPSPGNYSLRLKPSEYGEFELVFNDEASYWSTGNWTGKTFSGVPEMTVPYIYTFVFKNPFTPEAYFLYTEKSAEADLRPPLTRFLVDSSGQFKQYLWSIQTNNWDMFWSRPESICRVYGLCGTLGFCKGARHTLVPCECLAGFRPVDDSGWNSGDYSGGCRRDNDGDDFQCGENDGFVEVGSVEFDGVSAGTVSFPGDRNFCEATCLKNCSCVGLFRGNSDSGECKILYGTPVNLRNLTSASTDEALFYVRVSKSGFEEKKKEKEKWRKPLLISSICVGSVAVLSFGVSVILILQKRKKRRENEEEAVFPVTNLKVFSYKELYAATRGFSEKLGHGGFGAVFRGNLSDLTPVAVKRLERPGGGEREFRAEVCTIGNIQHVNLVRLRGFCSENSHRLLVYDYMKNGPLSVFLRRDGRNLSWDVRFRVALGTARGIAYLHEECRDCIIHCDIKPENILLDEDFTAKVSDFGLAKLVCRDFSRILTTMRGTWGYVAPEWISGVAITPKADVYSYGMTLLEIIGGRRNVEAPPVSGTGTGIAGEKWYFPPWAARSIVEGDVGGVVDEGLGRDYDAVEAERAALVAVWCIQDEENGRPTMGTVVKMLEGTVEIASPPVPQLLQALVSGDSFARAGIVSGKASSSSPDLVQNHLPESDIT